MCVSLERSSVCEHDETKRKTRSHVLCISADGAASQVTLTSSVIPANCQLQSTNTVSMSVFK